MLALPPGLNRLGAEKYPLRPGLQGLPETWCESVGQRMNETVPAPKNDKSGMLFPLGYAGETDGGSLRVIRDDHARIVIVIITLNSHLKFFQCFDTRI